MYFCPVVHDQPGWVRKCELCKRALCEAGAPASPYTSTSTNFVGSSSCSHKEHEARQRQDWPHCLFACMTASQVKCPRSVARIGSHLLEHVKAGDALLLHAVARIVQRRLYEARLLLRGRLSTTAYSVCTPGKQRQSAQHTCPGFVCTYTCTACRFAVAIVRTRPHWTPVQAHRPEACVSTPVPDVDAAAVLPIHHRKARTPA